MPDEAVGLVLRGHAEAPDAGVERVGQGKIDDPGLAAEEHRGLGPPVGQFHQAAAASPRQNIGHGVTGERCGPAGFCQFVLPIVFYYVAENSKIKVAIGGKVTMASAGCPAVSLAMATTLPPLPSPVPP